MFCVGIMDGKKINAGVLSSIFKSVCGGGGGGGGGSAPAPASDAGGAGGGDDNPG